LLSLVKYKDLFVAIFYEGSFLVIVFGEHGTVLSNFLRFDIKLHNNSHTKRLGSPTPSLRGLSPGTLKRYLSGGQTLGTESKIIELLEELSAPLECGHRVLNNLIPDLYNPHTNEAMGIKRHIKTGIKKEEEKYIEAFSGVTVSHSPR
jgi:hypothetical protein